MTFRMMMPERAAGTRGLAAIREARGLTQEQLAVRACLGSVTVYRLEHGQHTPRRSTLRLLADALGCEPGDLLPSNEKRPAGGPGASAISAGEAAGDAPGG